MLLALLHLKGTWAEERRAGFDSLMVVKSVLYVINRRLCPRVYPCAAVDHTDVWEGTVSMVIATEYCTVVPHICFVLILKKVVMQLRLALRLDEPYRGVLEFESWNH